MWKPLKLAPWFIALGFAWGLGFIYNMYYGGEVSFLRRMYFEKLAIAADLKAPQRVLLVGGSGVHHAFNSKLMEEKLGIPVINLGLDGPIGLNVLLPSFLAAVKPGDVVVLIPEHTLLTSPDGTLERSVPFGVAIGHPGLGDIPLRKFAEDGWLLGLPTFRGVIRSAIDLVEKGKFTGYYSDPITDRGDPTVVKYRKGNWWGWEFNQPMTPHAVSRISRFRAEVATKGGNLVLALPWVYAPPSAQNLAYVQTLVKDFSAIAPTIYDHKTYNLQQNTKDVADTHYHFLPEARNRHSEQMIQELKPILAELSSSPSPQP